MKQIKGTKYEDSDEGILDKSISTKVVDITRKK